MKNIQIPIQKYQFINQTKRKNTKRKAIKYGLLASTFVLLSFTAVYYINSFFEANTLKFQSPVLIQTPIRIEKRKSTETPQVKPAAITGTTTLEALLFPSTAVIAPPVVVAEPKVNIDEVVRKIRVLESSGGVNDGCKKKRLVNGYGYMQSTFHWKCYKSHAEVRGLVVSWFNDKLATMSLPVALCYYNTGYKTETCPYYKNYLKLK